MRKIGFAGTFDIFTKGHLWTVEQMVGIAEKAVIIIADNPAKKTMFSLVERVSMIESIIEHHFGCYEIDVVVVRDDYVAEWANREGIRLVRGIRNGVDFEYEKKLNYSNSTIIGADPTLFLIPPDELANVSSSYIKGWIGPIGWHNRIKNMLPAETYEGVIEKYLENEFKASVLELKDEHRQPYDNDVESLFTQLITAYSDPNRTYHNLTHLVHMISELKRAKLDSTHYALAVQTTFWHDYYLTDPNGKVSGEEASADHVITYLDEIIDFHHVRDIERAVRLTAHATRDSTTFLKPFEKVVISADLAILGRPIDEYERYKVAVRGEYKKYPFVEYTRGRIGFLEELHKQTLKNELFPHETYRDVYNTQAMNNLYDEIQALSQSLETALIAQ